MLYVTIQRVSLKERTDSTALITTSQIDHTCETVSIRILFLAHAFKLILHKPAKFFPWKSFILKLPMPLKLHMPVKFHVIKCILLQACTLHNSSRSPWNWSCSQRCRNLVFTLIFRNLIFEIRMLPSKLNILILCNY